MLVFTDGSHSRKPKMSGMGAVLIVSDKVHSFGAYTNKCSDNNVAEIAAIAMAIQYIKDFKIADRSTDKTINIMTDSSYAIHRLKYGTEGRDEFEKKCLKYIRDFLVETDKKVSFLHIKGHIHDGTKYSYYNNVADEIAGDYRRLGLEKQQVYINQKKNKTR